MTTPTVESQALELDATTLGKLPKALLYRLCEVACAVAKIPQPPAHASRAEIIVVLLKAAGYDKLKKVQVSNKLTQQELTIEELTSSHRRHLEDELALLHAVHSALTTALVIHDSTPPQDATMLSHSLEEALKDLRFYTGHSNIGRIANMYNLLNPTKRLNL